MDIARIVAALPFQAVVSRMKLLAISLDTGGRLVYCNDHFLSLSGWSLPDIVGCDWFERFVPAAIDKDVRRVFAGLLEDMPDTWQHENPIATRYGKRLLVRWHSSAVRDVSGRIVGVASIGENVSEQHVIEDDLLEASARERRHLAADLHDGLGQTLYGASLLATALEKTAHTAGLEFTRELRRLSSIIAAAIGTCHQVAHGLSPLTESRGDLVRALHDLTRMSRNDATQVSLRIIDNAPLQMPVANADHLFRLAQETLANALKHAAATCIRMSLDITPTSVILAVEDNGIGMPELPIVSDRLGLKLMRYRARMIGATLETLRIDPHGTRIVCKCPQGKLERRGGPRS
jgi:PAS domain S-box-containing protein